MARRSSLAVIIIGGLVAAVVAVVVLAAAVFVAVFVLADEAEQDRYRDTTAADVPDTLCDLVGSADLATWVPGATATSTVEGDEAICEAETPVGSAERSASFTARVVRFAPRDDQRGPSGEEQASDRLALGCFDPVDVDLDLGDETCVQDDGSSSVTGAASVDVRRGLDVVSISYFAEGVTGEQAQVRAVDAATRILSGLDD